MLKCVLESGGAGPSFRRIRAQLSPSQAGPRSDANPPRQLPLRATHHFMRRTISCAGFDANGVNNVFRALHISFTELEANRSEAPVGKLLLCFCFFFFHLTSTKNPTNHTTQKYLYFWLLVSRPGIKMKRWRPWFVHVFRVSSNRFNPLFLTSLSSLTTIFLLIQVPVFCYVLQTLCNITFLWNGFPAGRLYDGYFMRTYKCDVQLATLLTCLAHNNAMFSVTCVFSLAAISVRRFYCTYITFKWIISLFFLRE